MSSPDVSRLLLAARSERAGEPAFLRFDGSDRVRRDPRGHRPAHRALARSRDDRLARRRGLSRVLDRAARADLPAPRHGRGMRRRRRSASIGGGDPASSRIAIIPRSSTAPERSRRRSRSTSSSCRTRTPGRAQRRRRDRDDRQRGRERANFFSAPNKVIDLIGGLVSAGFAVFMIFTFTLYFLVYGRELSATGPDLLPTYRAPCFTPAAPTSSG